MLAVETPGGRNEVVFDKYRLHRGSWYLLFLAQCPDSPVCRLTEDETNAVLQGDTAIQGFGVPVFAAALLDSVEAMVRWSDPRRNWDAADAVIHARVDRIPDKPRDEKAEWVSVTIRSIYKGAHELRRKPGGTLSVRYRQTVLDYGLDPGPTAPILASREAALFLRRISSGWALLPTIYSEWRISGDSAYVEAAPPCCRGQRIVMQRLPWPSAMEDLSR
jgi:hypothetical protein